MSRFSLFDDSAIFEHATSVKLELHKCRGKIGIDFEIEGTIWPAGPDDDDQDDLIRIMPRRSDVDPVAFARSLLASFVCSSKGGAE